MPAVSAHEQHRALVAARNDLREYVDELDTRIRHYNDLRQEINRRTSHSEQHIGQALGANGVSTLADIHRGQLDYFVSTAREQHAHEGYALLPEEANERMPLGASAASDTYAMETIYQLTFAEDDANEHRIVVQHNEHTSIIRVMLRVDLGTALYAPDARLRQGLSAVTTLIQDYAGSDSFVKYRYYRRGVYAIASATRESAVPAARSVSEGLADALDSLNEWVCQQENWFAVARQARIDLKRIDEMLRKRDIMDSTVDTSAHDDAVRDLEP